MKPGQGVNQEHTEGTSKARACCARLLAPKSISRMEAAALLTVPTLISACQSGVL